MSTIHKNTSFKLDGIKSFSIGDDLYTWDGKWLAYVDVYAGDADKRYTVDVTLSGSDWAMSTLRINGNAKVGAEIEDASSGSGRFIEYLLLGNSNSPGSSVVLRTTSVDNLLGGGAADKVTLGSGDYSSVDLRYGDDTVTCGGGWIGSIRTSNGRDTVKAGSGNIETISTGDGNDRIVFGTGNVEAVAMGSGDDVVEGGASGWVGVLDTNSGDDTVDVNGGDIDLVRVSDGNNTVNINSGWVGAVVAYDNDDTVIVKDAENIGTISVGGGTNSVRTGKGYVNAIVAYGGVDTMKGGSGGGGSINAGGGNNVISTTGWWASITAYNGDDKVALGSGGAGSVALFGGNDSVTLSMLKEPGDTVALNGGKGFDSVSFAKFTKGVTVVLGAESDTGKGIFSIAGFEKLVGSARGDTLSGDGEANEIDGGKSGDTLNGGGGADTLTGGGGADRFVFDAKLGGGADTITDFKSGSDSIRLDGDVFGLDTGKLAGALFAANALGEATTEDQRIVYDTETGALFFDENGSKEGGAVQFAALSADPTLKAGDFLVI